MQHKQQLQPEGVTLLLPLTLLPAPGPGTLTAVKQLRPHQLTQLNPMQQDREQVISLGHLLAPKYSVIHSCYIYSLLPNKIFFH